MNRVVITGYGVASPIGNDANGFLNSSKEDTNGIILIAKFDASEAGVTLAGEARSLPYDKYFIGKDSKQMDIFSAYGVYAALEAMEINGLDKEKINQDRFGVIIGSGIGGLPTIENQVIHLHEKGAKRVSPMFVPVAIAGIAAGSIALRVGAKGICTAVVTTCASGTNSIGEAFRSVKHDYSSVILAGGTEATVYEIGITGFATLTALSEPTDPNRGSIPFDRNRNGFVTSGGTGVLVLESLEHAQARGAKIYGEIVGYDANCDAHHMTAPAPDGSGASKAMRFAMEEAGIQPEQAGYISAHGTNTPANDQAKTETIQLALGENFRDTYINGTKSMTGRLLGAAGGIKALATLMVLEHQFTPPTINVEEQDPGTDLTAVKNENKPASFTYTVSNSLGLGGHSAVLCMKRWEE